MTPDTATRAACDPRDARAILARGLALAGGPTALACSFSAEDIVVLDLLQAMESPVRVFALDTGRLPEETFEVAEEARRRYGVEIEWHHPDRSTVENLMREEGPFSFRDSLAARHECCRIRKVEPLRRALAGRAGWITGLRREQSITRAGLAPIELDEPHGGIVKINPLLEWSWDEVWEYTEEHGLPVNRLHREGYPSIGCAPCTRAVSRGEHPRAGRWWWESPEHKECGLHRP